MTERYRPQTTRGYDLYEVMSAVQKAIRRGETKLAGYFALEIFHSGFWFLLWKRLLTISAEDVADVITTEIYSLFQAFLYINDKRKEVDKGRIFISKAVIILCKALKNRDADHLQNFVYDKKLGITDKEINDFLKGLEGKTYKIPDYALDCHTVAGKIRGKTKEDFFRDELKGLNPRQKGLFDDLVE
jgi:replication-associated recombination protein RarA